MKNEPVLTAASIVSAIIAVASVFNVVIDPDTLTTIVTALLPIVAALIARRRVTPVK